VSTIGVPARGWLRALLPVIGALGLVSPMSACAADLSATPSSLAGVFAAAQAGDTILLASGDYGTFTGAMKPGDVKLAEQPGANATMALNFNPATNITIDGLTLTAIDLADSRTKNITIRNSDIPGQTTLHTSQLQHANILLDHNVHHDWNKCSSCGEGRLWLPGDTNQPSGITIQNSEFRGGLSDGIQNGSNGTRILNNVFHDLLEGSANGVHTDAIQLYGSSNTLIKGNYFHDVPDAIMAPDGANHETIEDNVVAADTPNGYPFAVTLYSDDTSIVRHNTFADGLCSFNLRCGIIRVGAKDSCTYPTECDPGHGTTIDDNVLGEASNGGGNATFRTAYNLLRVGASGVADILGLPTFVGGAHPATYAGYALAAGSVGKNGASDGLDRGIRLSGATPAGQDAPPSGAAARPGSRASVRVLSTLRSVARTGRLRLRVRTSAAGVVVVAATVRPGAPLAAYRRGYSRRIIKPRAVSLGDRQAGSRTVTLHVGRRTRRMLGHATSARLIVKVSIGGATTNVKLSMRR
jgi:hypothetical protein